MLFLDSWLGLLGDVVFAWQEGFTEESGCVVLARIIFFEGEQKHEHWVGVQVDLPGFLPTDTALVAFVVLF